VVLEEGFALCGVRCTVFTTEIRPQFRADDGKPEQIVVGMARDWVGCYRIAIRDLTQPRCDSEDRASSLEGYEEDTS
jgi:hypothetical protein